jgi:hypothetical protein
MNAFTYRVKLSFAFWIFSVLALIDPDKVLDVLSEIVLKDKEK